MQIGERLFDMATLSDPFSSRLAKRSPAAPDPRTCPRHAKTSSLRGAVSAELWHAQEAAREVRTIPSGTMASFHGQSRCKCNISKTREVFV